MDPGIVDPLDGIEKVDRYFLSGSNRATEIRGMTLAGRDVGCVATLISAGAMGALLSHSMRTGRHVFVDSGAFSEVKFGPEGRTRVKTLDWDAILTTQEAIANWLSWRAWVVAPDSVGSQPESLGRLERYRESVRAMERRGANILVPIQNGDVDETRYADEVDGILGCAWIPAFPCKKAATQPGAIERFLRVRTFRRVHLLGLGIKNRRLDEYLAACRTTNVTLDSCWLTANAGHTNGPGGGPRRYTKARGLARAVLPEGSKIELSELAAFACLAPERLTQ